MYMVNFSVFLTSDFNEWIPSYLFTHVVVILIGLWASRDRNVFEPIIAYIIAVAISILNDIILLGIYFSDAQDRADSKCGHIQYTTLSCTIVTDYADHTYRDTWRYSAGYPCLHDLRPLFVEVLFSITTHIYLCCNHYNIMHLGMGTRLL